MPNQWFRFYSEFANDPKVQTMDDSMQIRLVKILCLRCNGQNLETFQETEIAFHLRVSGSQLAETKALFLAKGFIDEQWNVINWNKRQFISDTSTERVRKHRQGLKQSETFPKQDETGIETPPEQNRTKSEHKKTTPQAAFLVPDWMPKESWDGWLEMRSKKRAPNTPRALTQAVKKLELLHLKRANIADVLDDMTLRGWTGVWESNGLFNQKDEPRRITPTPPRSQQ